MPIKRELLEILVCPEAKTPLREADVDLIASLNLRIAGGEVRDRSGEPVSEKMESGLLRADGRFLYPIRDGIPVMLIDEAIPL